MRSYGHHPLLGSSSFYPNEFHPVELFQEPRPNPMGPGSMFNSPPCPPSTLPPTTTSFDELLNRMILQHSPSPPTQPFPLNLIVDAIYRPTITTPTPTATPTATPTYSLLNRNARKPRRANAGKRPCSHVARRKKRRKNGSWRRGH